MLVQIISFGKPWSAVLEIRYGSQAFKAVPAAALGSIARPQALIPIAQSSNALLIDCQLGSLLAYILMPARHIAFTAPALPEDLDD